MNVQQFLHERQTPFNAYQHESTYTAQTLAQSLDVPGDMVAKTVVLKVEDEYVLAVLQATHSVDIHSLREVLNTDRVELVTEEHFAQLFPDCEIGAIPPFGSEYGMKTLVDQSLTQDEFFVFEGNKHGEAISMRYQDYAKIENPQVAAFTLHV